MTVLPVNVPTQTAFACRLCCNVFQAGFSKGLSGVPRIAGESSGVLYIVVIIFVATCFYNNVQL